MNQTKFVLSAEKPDATFDTLYWTSKAGILRHQFPAHPDICVCFRLEHCGMTPIKLAGRTLPPTACTSSTDPRPGSSGTKTFSLITGWLNDDQINSPRHSGMRTNLCARRLLCSFEFSHYHLENQCLHYRCVNAQLNGVQALVTWLVFVFGVNSRFMLRCHKPQLEHAHGNYPSLKVKNTKDFWISWEAPKSSSNVKIRYTLGPSIT